MTDSFLILKNGLGDILSRFILCAEGRNECIRLDVLTLKYPRDPIADPESRFSICNNVPTQRVEKLKAPPSRLH